MLAHSRSMSVLVVGGSLAVAATGLGSAIPAAATTAAPAALSRTTIHLQMINQKNLVGKRLTARHSRTVYMFAKDTKNNSNCGKKCRKVWPPVRSKHAARAGAHVSKSKLGLIAHHQVTYRGHPLYYYIHDHHKRQAHGEFVFRFGAYWYTVTKKGGIG
jgi:predicted lipoprotein with Yx(FWY)xxD motif